MTVQNNTKKAKETSLFSTPRGRMIMLCLCGVAGLLLLLYGGGILGGDKTGEQSAPERRDLAEYTAALEQSIEQICASVAGVSNVTVAVTFKSGFEYVYAVNSQTKADGAVEVKYITVGSGSGEGTVYITEKLPEIAGVGIVCRGGSDPSIVQKLTALISAAYGVGSNKIYITGA